MAQAALVDAAIRGARELIDRLDATGFHPDSALWLYRTDSNDWILLLGASGVSEAGTRAGYMATESLLRTQNFGPIRLDDVVIVDNDDPLLRVLRVALKTGPELSEIRFTRNRIGNTFIEDALIYRLQESSSLTR